MHVIFLKEERARQAGLDFNVEEAKETRSLGQTVVYFATMIIFLVFANWGKPLNGDSGIWALIYQYRWWISVISLLGLFATLIKWFNREELKEWVAASWLFALQILPLLLGGILISGFLLGRVGYEGIIPSKYVATLVGGNSLFANFFASLIAAFMYFATLTEVPILQGLLNSGMGNGPALALLLAGPSLSLPSMLVIASVIGIKKTIVYVSLVVIMATISGMVFGAIAS